MYAAIDHAEQGHEAPPTSKPTSRRTVVAFGLAVAFAAIGGFAVGAKTAAPAPRANLAASKHDVTGKVRIIPDCYNGKHAEGSLVVHIHGLDHYEWDCVYDSDGSLVRYSDFFNAKITEFRDEGYVVNGDVKPYDASDLSGDCSLVAFDKDNTEWRCLNELTSASLAPWDLAYRATRSATAVYSGSEEVLYDGSGWFKYDWDNDRFKWKSGRGRDKEVAYAYEIDKKQGKYKLWKDVNDPSTNPGFYWVNLDCDDGPRYDCWLSFYCMKSNTADLFDEC